jgi:predicted CopG family antitoxin
MATKTISITTEAYDILASWKTDHDSFSDVILKMGRKEKLSSFAGILSGDDWRKLDAAIKKGRARSRRRSSLVRI